MSLSMLSTTVNGFTLMADCGPNSTNTPVGLAAELLERAPEIEQAHLRVDRAVRPGDLVQQHRLAGAGRADDRGVEVALVVVVEIERHQLAAPAGEQQRRGGRAAPLADQRRQVDGIGHGLARHAAHALHVGVEAFADSVIGRLAISDCRCM